MKYLLLKYGEFSLEYTTIGSGSEVLIAFHGFGRHASDYAIFESTLGKKYTIYSFNLFHHGRSVYPKERIEKDTLSMDELRSIYGKVLDDLGIDRFSVIGYSMGGKFALSMTQFYAPRMNRLILIAPDGISLNRWYWFASHTWLGRKLYKFIIYRPNVFFAAAKFFKWIRIIPPKGYEFATRNMMRASQRQQVFDTWMSLRDIHPDNTEVQQMLNKHQIDTHLIFGRFDSVIPTRIGERFMRKLDKAELHVMESGHVLLTEETNTYIQHKILGEF